MRSFILLAALMSVTGPAVAQTAAQKDSASRVWLEKVMGIPNRADEARKAGVPDSTVKTVLDILRKKEVPPEDVDVILSAERDAAREHGPTDNFGAFVQSQLDKGLRGRELSAAIRAEHARVKGLRGKGADKRDEKGKGAEMRDDKGKGAEMRNEKGKGAEMRNEKGKGAEKGASKGKRPDSTGAARGKLPNN